MSRHHDRAGWAGRTQAIRKRLEPTLPAPCVQRCGRLVEPGQLWDVAHLTDLALGGDLHHYGVAHRSCNRSAGGRLGAAMSNKRRRANSRKPSW